MSPRYTQVMMVIVYSSLTAVNKPSFTEWRMFELTDYECEWEMCRGKCQIVYLSEPEPTLLFLRYHVL